MANDKPNRFTREDLQQPSGTTLNHNSDGTPKSNRQIKWEQSLVDIANSLGDLSKAPVNGPKEDN